MGMVFEGCGSKFKYLMLVSVAHLTALEMQFRKPHKDHLNLVISLQFGHELIYMNLHPIPKIISSSSCAGASPDSHNLNIHV
jgi:hypothetical protein